MCLKTVQTTIMLHIQSSLPCFHSAGNKMVAALVLEHPQLQLNSWSMFLKAFLGRKQAEAKLVENLQTSPFNRRSVAGRKLRR